jgi:hypothetical protein
MNRPVVRLCFHLFLLLAAGTSVSTADTSSQETRLNARADLSRQGQLFLERTDGTIEVFGGGWKLKSFQVASSVTDDGHPVRITRVLEIVPDRTPPSRVIDVGSIEAPDPSGSAEDPDEIVGVEEMPAGFRVRFDDGTVWVLSSSRFGNILAEGRGLWERIRHQFQDDTPPLNLVFLRTDSTSARHLFWIIQQEMQVIQ